MGTHEPNLYHISNTHSCQALPLSHPRDELLTAVADVGVMAQAGLAGLQLLQNKAHHLNCLLSG